jgi:hypothetical protein
MGMLEMFSNSISPARGDDAIRPVVFSRIPQTSGCGEFVSGSELVIRSAISALLD